MRTIAGKRRLAALTFVVAAVCAAFVYPALQASGGGSGGDPYVDALRRSIAFFSSQAADGGAYKRSYDLSMSQRDPVGTQPWTAQAGIAYISAYDATGEPGFLEHAKEIAKLLDRTQIGNTGGWWSELYTSDYPNGSGGRLFYRTDAEAGRSAPDHSDYSVYRGDITPSALRFLMRLDQAEGGTDRQLRHVIDYGLAGLLTAAYQPSGGYPDIYYTCGDSTSIRCKAAFPVVSARVPATWPTTWPVVDVAQRTQFYSLNDATTPLVIETLLEAWHYTHDSRYRAAAVAAADWLVRAQFPSPQAGWSQVYDRDMNPSWDRVFEPPALSTRETGYAIRALLHVYRLTRSPVYRSAAGRAADWMMPLGFKISKQPLIISWPMFIEFGSNKPVFVDTNGTMTTDWSASDDWPNYGFFDSEDFRLIPNELENAASANCSTTPQQRVKLAARMKPRADAIVQALDAKGRWVTNGQISTDRFWANVESLSAYVGLRRNRHPYLDAESVIRHLVSPREDPCRYLAR